FTSVEMGGRACERQPAVCYTETSRTKMCAVWSASLARRSIGCEHLIKMPAKETKRLFLIDAMGYIFRAFYAPMDRLQTAARVPTKVPYLFATMLRRILKSKEFAPHYIAVVFDHSAPTFRDKLFAQYKAQRAPMPNELALQIPFVRRYCAAMHLPIIEVPG